MATTLRQRIRLFGWPARGVARPWLVAATVAAMVAVAPLASAQVLYGTITGNVIDGTGAALPGHHGRRCQRRDRRVEDGGHRCARRLHFQ